MRAFVLAQVASLGRFSLAQKPDTKLLYVASRTGPSRSIVCCCISKENEFNPVPWLPEMPSFSWLKKASWFSVHSA